jgi:aminopeptidase N
MIKRFLFFAFLFLMVRFSFAEGRLPHTTVPLHYAITIFPDLKNLTFEGKENVVFRVLTPTQTVVLNSLDLNITQAELSSPLFPKPLQPQIKINKETETAAFVFPKKLQKGTYQLELAWNGKISINPRGLFYVKYTSGKTQKILLSTQFESVDARRMFPCWDEPAYKATFQLSAKVPKNFLAVSNMPVESKQDLPDGQVLVRFEPTPKMSSYLLVFTEGDLKYLSGESDGVKIRVIAPAGEEQNGAFALAWAEKVLHYYDWYYGVKYPLPKLDLIAIPGGFGGAMENWGGITFNEALLLYDPQKSSEETKERIALVEAHEMAHQWTGDLVTMKWWDDLWLNEGFADWMMTKVTNHFFPKWHLLVRVAEDDNSAMTTDALATTHPIERPVPYGRLADSIFDEITYEKGAAVIRMIESYLGENTFRKGIDLYMHRYQYSNATSMDLWKALSDESHENIAPLALGWIRQPGFPVVKVESRCIHGKEILSFTQTPFTYMRERKLNYRWEIPITVETLGGKPKHFLLTSNQKITFNKNACNLPIVFLNQGYYRIEYSPELFQKVLAVVNQLSPSQKVHLLYDTWALAEQGSYPVSSYLDLVQPLSHMANLAVWAQILQAFQNLDVLEIGEPGRKKFHLYEQKILKPILTQIGWDEKPREGPTVAILRANVIETLGMADDKAVVEEAFKRFNAFLSHPDSLSPNLRPAVFRIVGRYADQKTFDELHKLGLQAQTTEQKYLYYNALYSALDPKLAAEALQISLSNELDPVSAVYGILGVAFSGEHPNLAWDFVQKHIKVLQARLPGMQLGFFLQNLIASFHGDPKGKAVGEYALKHFPKVVEPLIAKGLAINQLQAYLKAHMVPQVDAWVAKFLQSQKAAAN